MAVRLALALYLALARPLPEDLTFGDWRSVFWNASFCWDAAWSFADCCRNGLDVEALPEIMAGTRKVQGHPHCWQEPGEGPMFHDNCCVLNGNLEKVPRYDHMIWQLRMPSGKILNILQGQVLHLWAERGIVPAFFPLEPLRPNGEGLLWEAGESALVLSLAQFQFPTKRPRMLEVASSVGAPSLVALHMGFEVYSTDLRSAGTWHRRQSAVSSFGEGAEELERLHTPELDILDESTWPSLDFEVILLASPFFVVHPLSGQQDAFCDGFQKLVSKRLAAHGLALMFLNPSRLQVAGGDLRQTYAKRCLAREGLEVVVHRPLAEGLWQAEWLSEDLLDFDVDLKLPMVFSLRRAKRSFSEPGEALGQAALCRLRSRGAPEALLGR